MPTSLDVPTLESSTDQAIASGPDSATFQQMRKLLLEYLGDPVFVSQRAEIQRLVKKIDDAAADAPGSSAISER